MPARAELEGVPRLSIRALGFGGTVIEKAAFLEEYFVASFQHGDGFGLQLELLSY
jgi:hypothetical protein